MPTAGKIFVSTEYKPLEDLAASLEGFREEVAPMIQPPRISSGP